jgi:3D (Asp-Asp-Asp) domain-containing protein
MLAEIMLTILIYFAPHTATATAYSPANVDPRWGGVARWTGEPPVVGVSAACPKEWAMEWVYIEGYGKRQCHDTPRTGWYDDGSPHVDVYLGSQQEALRHGIQQLTVWKARN